MRPEPGPVSGPAFIYSPGAHSKGGGGLGGWDARGGIFWGIFGGIFQNRPSLALANPRLKPVGLDKAQDRVCLLYTSDAADE